MALASQLAVLQGALSQVLKLLKNGGSSLLTAKLLVLARLLHKSLAQSADASPLVESLGRRLGSLRQKLLRYIDRRLVRLQVDTESLVEHMTAFSLATSSTSMDILRHFQQLRLNALTSSNKSGEADTQGNILKRLALFLATRRESRMIFPELVGASLRVLGARSLLSDATITSIAELDLDIHEKWFSDEVRNFTPYTRQNAFSQEKADALIEDWARDALRALTEAIGTDLSQVTNLADVAGARKEVLQTWLSSKRDAQGLSTRQILEELRQPFSSRMEELIKETLTRLQKSLSTPVVAILNDWSTASTEITCPSLWDPSTLEMEVGDGAILFRQAIVDRRMGTSSSIKTILHGFEGRAKELEDMQALIKDMKSTRWEDDFDDDDDDDDSESTRDVLTRVDPQEFQLVLSDGTRDLIRGIERLFTFQLGHLVKDCDTPTSPGIWILRIIRGLRARLPRLLAPINGQLSQSLLCEELVESLQVSITEAVESKTTPAISASLDSFVRSQRPARSLWDGTPPLPVMPTPATFRYLRGVVKEMGTLGTDLWNPRLARTLKITLKASLSGEIQRVLSEMQTDEEDVSSQSVGVEDVGPLEEAVVEQDTMDDSKERREENLVEMKGETDNYVADSILNAPNSAAEDDTFALATTELDTTAMDDARETVDPSQAADAESSLQTEETGFVVAAAATVEAEAAAEAEAEAEAATLASEETQALRAQSHDKLTQLLFDLLYLQQALATTPASSSSTRPSFPTVAAAAAPATATVSSTKTSASPPSSHSAQTVDSRLAQNASVDLDGDGHGDVDVMSRTIDAVALKRAAYESLRGGVHVADDAGASGNVDVGRERVVQRDEERDAEREKERERLRKAAVEYWRRTYALFGLLVGAGS